MFYLEVILLAIVGALSKQGRKKWKGNYAVTFLLKFSFKCKKEKHKGKKA